MEAEAIGCGEVEEIYDFLARSYSVYIEIVNTLRCGSQSAIRVVSVPSGGLVESILDIVHEPKHVGSRY